MNGSLSWQRRILSNGLTVLLYQRPSAVTAQLSLAIKYGSNDDPEDKIGTAHLLEHMIVGGSQKRIKLHHEIERLGGASNFETSRECTFSFVDVFSERLPEASKVLSGLLFDSTFEKDKLIHEQKVTLNEIAEAYDDPRDRNEETLLKCLFKHHPVKNPILGSRKTVNQITLEAVEKTHETQYSPQNMIIVLTGKFLEKDAEKVLEDFQDREKGNSISRQLRSNEEGKPRREIIAKRSGIKQAYLSFGLRTPPAKDKDIPAIELTNAILGIGESSRLFTELREKRALTYDCGSVNVAGLDFGYLYIDCAVKPKAVEKTQSIIQYELQKLKNQKATRIDIEKSKNLIISDVFRAIDSSSQLPRVMVDSEIYFENENLLATYIDKTRSLSEEDVKEVADKYFQENNYATAIVVPKTY